LRRYANPLWVSFRQLTATFYGFLGEHLETSEEMQKLWRTVEKEQL
jgi:hypothetical protein